jgi:hypothetical protein
MFVYYSAIYLALTLFYGTMAVVCTIFVLDTYNREDEIPNWLRKITLNFLVKLTCWKGCSCKSKTRRIHDEPEAIEEKPTFAERPKTPNSIYKPPLEDNGLHETALTWKDIGDILDKCFLRLFLFVIFLTGLVCLSTMAAGSGA